MQNAQLLNIVKQFNLLISYKHYQNKTKEVVVMIPLYLLFMN